VTIATSFAIGKVEVTVDRLTAFVQETGYDAGSEGFSYDGNKWIKNLSWSWRNPGFAQTGLHPATYLNWHDAKAYLK
jgi:formylglycine-generating enzyme required for sulfatase activity